MPSAPVLSFRFKILLLIIVILSGAIGSTMVVTQRRVQATYQKLFARQYETQIEFFNNRQRLRLANVITQGQQLANDEEFISALERGDMPALPRRWVYRHAGKVADARVNGRRRVSCQIDLVVDLTVDLWVPARM